MINVKAAARAKASVITESHASFKMSHWHAKNACGASACLAGHIWIANGGEVHTMEVDGSGSPKNSSGDWFSAAYEKLFDSSARWESEPDLELSSVKAKLDSLFLACGLRKDEVLSRFDEIMEEAMTDEEWEEYNRLVDLYTHSEDSVPEEEVEITPVNA